ncbi:MAG: CHASE3 domain-containing protein [Actinomycetota bacterium]|nr:CHASE3 domain-containing protein [Actinomycetota bacterium]
MWLVGSITAVVALGALVAGTVAIAELTAARRAVIDELDPALLNTQVLVGSLLDQETAVRGFALTANPTLLEPDEQGRRQQEIATATLRRLPTMSDRPELSSALDDVLDRARVWRTEYAEPTIAAVRAGGTGSAPVDPTAGKARFDAVRAALDVQRDRLIMARRGGLDVFRTAAVALTVTAIAIAVGLVGLLAALGVWTRRTISAPISRLADSVRVVAGGEFDRRPAGTGPREIVELADDVDSMRARILTELHASQELNSQLNRQTEELARSNRDLEQFAYVASHDLQEPLRKVAGFCELLRSRYGGQLDERADQYIDFAVDGARRMSRLIADLLALSRVGRIPVPRQELDCAALLDQAVRNLGIQVAETGAEVTRDPLPSVLGESTLLVTMFQNLVGNAIKFRAEQPPRVHVGTARRDGLWEFRISDNGIGIDPAFAEKVFVIFQRLHPKDAYPGTGIGLALCRRIVEYHGGSIWLDPEQASGAAICFTLPTIDSATRDADRQSPG